MKRSIVISFAVVAGFGEAALAQPGGPSDAPPAPTPYSPAPYQPYQPATQPAPQPAPYAEPSPSYEPPPGYGAPPQPYAPQGATRATFVSTAATRFDVRIDDNAVCTTPCSIMVEPVKFVTLHSHDRNSERLSVGYMPPGEVLVQAKPRAQGAFAAGVTFTSLSGMGLVTGITLTAVGCSTERTTMCNAGLITGGVSAIGLYLSIDLLRRSLPKVHVGPARPYVGANQVGLAGTF